MIADTDSFGQSGHGGAVSRHNCCSLQLVILSPASQGRRIHNAWSPSETKKSRLSKGVGQPSLRRDQQTKKGESQTRPTNKSGNDLLSHTVARVVPSAREGLTAEFGMGSGVTPPLWSPENSWKEHTVQILLPPKSGGIRMTEHITL